MKQSCNITAYNLFSKTAAVTDAISDIGSECARTFLRASAWIVLIDHDCNRLAALVDELDKNTSPLTVDFSEHQVISELFPSIFVVPIIREPIYIAPGFAVKAFDPYNPPPGRTYRRRSRRASRHRAAGRLAKGQARLTTFFITFLICTEQFDFKNSVAESMESQCGALGCLS